ncbi:hypothetical protein [Gordonia hydrophobica]|uniref:Uncharacterized protein n=1 Tax=Gordonia hydrophobica TaxID=40516 RepID=A0ABZ2U0V8_9ACTN|nr:hypothetical protein [Gordonia hydrophobica]MBM7368424.1 hypothetical protein [Gordonia hydrophobica]
MEPRPDHRGPTARGRSPTPLRVVRRIERLSRLRLGGRLVGEFDGLRKYCRDIRPGEKVEDVVVREKLREDALREIVDDVVRWIWRDLEERTMVPKVMRKMQRLGLA